MAFSRLPYHQRLFLLLLAYSWVLVTCCLMFQYGREKQYKAEQLDAKLQLYNMHLMDALDEGTNPALFIRETDMPFADLRVSIIGSSGKVFFDNSLDSLPAGNHLSRPEIVSALKSGTGYTIRRHSQTTDGSYFYSALSDGHRIVRSAVPYSVSLQELLQVDRGFLWFMFGLTLALSIIGYFATRRLGHTISRLNRFAEKAERGERVYADDPFPRDELGDISRHIVQLYAHLQEAIADRDRQHELALHEEQEKIRIKKQLTNNINHELKTPVAAIQICLETLLMHPELTEEKRRDFLTRCQANSERLRRLLADVATITRIDEGSSMIQKEPVCLNDLIEEMVRDYELHSPESSLRIHTDLPTRVELSGNLSLLNSIFRNLTDNANAYSGGQNIYIRLLENTPEFCRISFADDGTGIGEQHLSRIFERFYRIDKGRSRKMGGTGLGLSIVKNAVLFHGGSITANNLPEGGLKFEFTLRKQ